MKTNNTEERQNAIIELTKEIMDYSTKINYLNYDLAQSRKEIPFFAYVSQTIMSDISNIFINVFEMDTETEKTYKNIYINRIQINAISDTVRELTKARNILKEGWEKYY